MEQFMAQSEPAATQGRGRKRGRGRGNCGGGNRGGSDSDEGGEKGRRGS